MLRDLFVRIKGDKTSLDSTLKGAEGSVNKFSGAVKKLGGMIAGAFAVTSLIAFGKEITVIAGKMEGIKKGFDQIGNESLLEGLRKATKNTVSDMNLMARAVQASNFQIPLKDLASLFEFASARAVQTGQSVDYLVDSIILGIGRKSPLILDNLGISAVRLREVLKGAGTEVSTVADIAAAVGKIATEELSKMGGMAETAGVKMQQLTAATDNLKASWGKFVTESKAFPKIIDWTSTMLQLLSDNKVSLWDKLRATPDEYKEWKRQTQEAEAWMKKVGLMGDVKTAKPFTGAWTGKGGAKEKEIETLATLNEKLKKEQENLQLIDIADRNAIRNQLKIISNLEKQIELLGKLDTAPERANVKPLTGILSGSSGTLAGAPAAGNPALAAEMAASVQDLSSGLDESQQALVNLADEFAGFFSDVNMGFQGMIEGVISGIKRLVMELAAKAAFLAILSAIFPGAGVSLNLQNILGGNIGKLIGGGTTGSTSSGLGNVVVPSGSIGTGNLTANVTMRQFKVSLQRSGEANG